MHSKIILTVDVEDWFQVENLRSCIPFSAWNKYELRVEKNTHRLLDLFDSFLTETGGVSATFFVLGWIAERLPHLAREIHKRGHEVASHGYFHGLCTGRSAEDLKQELIRSKKFLEDTIGAQVFGYRAPSFSVSDKVLDIVRECGYLYDSSYNSFDINERYGQISLNSARKCGTGYEVLHNFYELPVSNLVLGKIVLPWAGGGYFRLVPFPLFRKGVRYILKKNGAYVFYIHPWEIDHAQPRVENLPQFFKFRHYINLHKTFDRLRRLITGFDECQFVSCIAYLRSVAGI